MKSYLSLIPISAKVHRRQNRMTLLCIVFAVFMVTAVFSMTEMGFRMEQARLVGKHGSFSIGDLLGSSMGQTLLSVAVVLFLLILIAGVLMISSSMNSSVAQRTQFFGMMRCIGMSKQQTIRFVRLEALNWCKTAIPIYTKDHRLRESHPSGGGPRRIPDHFRSEKRALRKIQRVSAGSGVLCQGVQFSQSGKLGQLELPFRSGGAGTDGAAFCRCHH